MHEFSEVSALRDDRRSASEGFRNLHLHLSDADLEISRHYGWYNKCRIINLPVFIWFDFPSRNPWHDRNKWEFKASNFGYKFHKAWSGKSSSSQKPAHGRIEAPNSKGIFDSPAEIPASHAKDLWWRFQAFINPVCLQANEPFQIESNRLYISNDAHLSHSSGLS